MQMCIKSMSLPAGINLDGSARSRTPLVSIATLETAAFAVSGNGRFSDVHRGFYLARCR